MNRPVNGRVTCIMGVPIDSVGAASASAPGFGTEQMPGALRAAGLTNALAIPDAGDLDVRLVDPRRDPESGLVAWPSVETMTARVRSTLAELTGRGERPLVLGGCCALLPGVVAGLRDAKGHASVVNVDGHLDLYDATTSPTGEVADVPMAALLGTGVPALAAVLAPHPVVSPGRIALVGHRDWAQAERDGSKMPADVGVHGSWDVDAVRSGAAITAAAVLDHLPPDPMWIHLDLDVLDEQVLPATDYLMPGGLDIATLTELLGPLVAAERFAGMSVGCLNPDKDPGGASARAVTELLVDLLG